VWRKTVSKKAGGDTPRMSPMSFANGRCIFAFLGSGFQGFERGIHKETGISGLRGIGGAAVMRKRKGGNRL